MIHDVKDKVWHQTRDEEIVEETSSSEDSSTRTDSSRGSCKENDITSEGEEGNNIILFASRRDDLTSKDGTTNLVLVRPIPIRLKEATSVNSDNEDGGSLTNHCGSTTGFGEPSDGSEDDTGEVNCHSNRPKRVLSSNRLNITSTPVNRAATSCKRLRSSSEDEILSMDNTASSSLYVIESEEALDQRLGEELKVEVPRTPTPSHSSPIPLLTPPQSPRQSIVEWPSNLVVDSALMAVANDIRPLSPASLMEESEQRQAPGKQKEQYLVEETCGLTRRLSFIRVGND